MKLVKRRALAVSLALSACADPAVLEIEVRVEETEVDVLTLKVTRGPEARMLFDCRLPFDRPAEGTCPDDDGIGIWEDPRELRFILYGKPSTDLSIEVEGLRLERSVTTTATAVELPGNPGERRFERLTLVGLTQERFRCGYKVEPVGGETSLNPEEQTSLAVVAGQGEGSARIAIVAARGRLGRVRRVRADDGCTLEYTAIAEPVASANSAAWCHVTPGSLVVSPSALARAGNNTILAAASCATTGEARIKAASFTLSSPGSRVFELLLARPRAQISPLVLADVLPDVGDVPLKEVVFIARNGAAATDPVELVVWQPRLSGTTNATVTIPLPGVRLDSSLVAPVVVPTRAGDLLVVSGGNGDWGIVDRTGFTRVGAEPGRNLRGHAVLATGTEDGLELYSIHASKLVKRTVIRELRAFRVEITEQPLIGEEISANLDLRLAIGSVDADDEQEIVVSQYGYAHVFGRTGGAVTELDLWGGTIPGEQAVLLANLDRLAGAEIISVGLQSSLLQAADAGGRPLDGWPLALGGQGGRRHVVISELDGGRDLAGLRDAEIVALSSDGIVEVITLGPGSYDSAHTPWPSATRGAAGATAYVSEADPQVRPVQ